ncbi:MAG: polysaccharide biosynthesis tyrosine autokinase [Terrimicrobiaceae bacterium]
MSTQEPDSGDPFSSGGDPAFDMAGFLRTSIRLWWIPSAFLLLGLGTGFLLLKTAKPEFVATSEIKVERRASTSAISLSGNPLAVEGATTPEDLKTIEKSFVNPMLVKRVVQEIKSAGLDGLTLGGWPLGKLDDDGIAGFLIKDCKVLLVPDTRLIQVSFTNPDPVMAQRICNMIVEKGIEYDRDQRISAVGVNIRYLKDEVKKMEENLRTSEEKLNTYTRTLRNVSIDSNMNIVADQLKELDSRSTQAKAERLKIESDLAQIQGCQDDPDRLAKIESVQKMPSVVSLNAQIADSNNKLSKLALRYREDNPYMRQAQTELKELQSALLAAIRSAPNQVEAALAGAKKKEEGLLRERASQEEKVIQVRDLSVPSRVLQRQIDADRLAYEAALKRLSEELSQARSQPVLLQIVNPAGPGAPAGSKALKLGATALIVSLGLGFGLIFLVMQLDSSIKSPEEAEQFLGLSVLSAIPEYLPPKDAAHQAPAGPAWEHCPAITDKFSSTAEGIRSLRAALRVIEEEEAGNFILLASAVEGEGKSFCAANLAVAMAQAGQRTLLVDADLRQPSLERIVFGNGGREGLSNYLQRECGLPSVIHSTPLPNLDIVSAGTPCPFPAETITRQGILDFLTEAKPLYDKIVVDSAPVGIVSDTLSFARLFPFVCLVIRSGKTPKAAAKRAQELLKRSAARLSGVVLNFAPRPFHSPLAGMEPDLPSATAGAPPEISCPACGKTYASLSACLAGTSDEGGTSVGQVRNLKRKCACGCVFAPAVSNRRDPSGEGAARRKVFGELIGLLQSSGMTHDQARRQLLLTLKVWRNELSGNTRHDASAASQERNRMFQELVGQLVAAGLSEDQAERKLLEAAETWRKAP